MTVLTNPKVKYFFEGQGGKVRIFLNMLDIVPDEEFYLTSWPIDQKQDNKKKNKSFFFCSKFYQRRLQKSAPRIFGSVKSFLNYLGLRNRDRYSEHLAMPVSIDADSYGYYDLIPNSNIYAPYKRQPVFPNDRKDFTLPTRRHSRVLYFQGHPL